MTGFFVPPISPALRSLWGDVLGDDAAMLRTALAMDAITIEFVWIGGPLLTAIVVVASPRPAPRWSSASWSRRWAGSRSPRRGRRAAGADRARRTSASAR